MEIRTLRYGTLEIDDSKVLWIQDGLLGFSAQKRYVILDGQGDSPFKWFACVDDPALAFVIVDPCEFVPTYRVPLKAEHLEDIGAASADEVVVAAIVTMASDIRGITMNLQGPLIINPQTMRAKQVVLEHAEYTTKEPVFPQGKPAATPQASAKVLT